MERKCNLCKQSLDLITWFRKNKTKPHGHDLTCRVCSLKYDLKKRAKRKGFIESYGPDDFWRALRRFDMRCFNCSSSERISIDHHYPDQPLSDRNAVALCERCNESKGCKYPEHFYRADKLHDIAIILGLK
jgi:protein-arginine kinase activator protein McsA